MYGCVSDHPLSPPHDRNRESLFCPRSNTTAMSQLDVLINKATDETLTSDNWQYLLDVCDAISSNPETNTKAAITIIKARLAKRDANIILRTLSLILAIAENCGSRMKQEIASTSFLQDALIKKLGDRKLHKQVKFQIAEVIQQLNNSFKGDPSLRPISDAYNTVKSKYSQYLKSAPVKPAKQQLSDQDRQKEDFELERALKLSVKEFEREQNIRKSYLDSKPLPATQQGEKAERGSNQAANGRSRTSPPQKDSSDLGDNSDSANTATIASIKKVCALYDLISYEPDELSFRKGDIITVIESVYRDWWRGSLANGSVGIFPLNYVTPVIQKSQEELAKELKLENRLIDIELKKVDKLLALLSSNAESTLEEEATAIYNDIIPLKGSLAKLIDKHSSRKEELRALHEQVGGELKFYNDLVDQIVSGKAQQQLSYNLTPYPTAYEGAGARTGDYLVQQPTSAGFGNSQLPTGQLTGQANQSSQYGQAPYFQGPSSESQETGRFAGYSSPATISNNI